MGTGVWFRIRIGILIEYKIRFKIICLNDYLIENKIENIVGIKSGILSGNISGDK